MDKADQLRRSFLPQPPIARSSGPKHSNHAIKTEGDPRSALANHRVHQLSEIREVSICSSAPQNDRSFYAVDGVRELPSTPPAKCNTSSESLSSDYATPQNLPEKENRKQTGLGSRATSTMSLPLQQVPQRRSSASIFAQSLSGSRQVSLQDLPSWKVPSAPPVPEHAVPVRGRADSPVKQSLCKTTQSSDNNHRSPSRTFIRTRPPVDLLETGNLRHSRLELSVKLPLPLFVGGGTIEGSVLVKVDGGIQRKKKEKQIHISRLSIDVIGVEKVTDGRSWIFLSLGSELFDETHPPPASIVESQLPISGAELAWAMKPSSASIPFCINLPLNLGPPPYSSKQASIRYLLCPSVHIKVGEKRSVVRQIWNIQMLTVHDPQKALASLPSPLLATDSIVLAQMPIPQKIDLTAGLHRQVWVNGGLIFIDIHVANRSDKIIKRIDIQLEKIILWYSHAAAGTVGKSASHLRLPNKTDKEIISSYVVKKCKDWRGIPSHSSEVRTCGLEAPRGHVTISTGRYFEIRYFVNVIVAVTMFKSITVQLPISLIHMNSLDILPNSLAQVAASIEAKRSKTVPVCPDTNPFQEYHQGLAFSAVRRQSLDQAHRQAGAEAIILTQNVDISPRGSRLGHKNAVGERHLSLFNEDRMPLETAKWLPKHQHNSYPFNCSHCEMIARGDGQGHSPANKASYPGPKLPRLQVSTSGLGFSETEFEIAPDSPPRKVMLSELERRMINQQRELRMQRQLSRQKRNLEDLHEKETNRVESTDGQHSGWNNTAEDSVRNSTNTNFEVEGRIARSNTVNSRPSRVPYTRLRSKTNPEALIRTSNVRNHRKGPRSMDKTRMATADLRVLTSNMNINRKSRDHAGRGSLDGLS